MTEEELQAIEEAESKMTRGPWYEHDEESAYWKIKGAHGSVVCHDSTNGTWPSQDDIDGVIALRNAAPALIAEVRRLRAALEVYADGASWKRGPARDDDAREWVGDSDGYDVARAPLKGTTP